MAVPEAQRLLDGADTDGCQFALPQSQLLDLFELHATVAPVVGTQFHVQVLRLDVIADAFPSRQRLVLAAG